MVESVHVIIDEDLHKGKKTIINQIEELHSEDQNQSESEQEEEASRKATNKYV